MFLSIRTYNDEQDTFVRRDVDDVDNTRLEHVPRRVTLLTKKYMCRIFSIEVLFKILENDNDYLGGIWATLVQVLRGLGQ